MKAEYVSHMGTDLTVVNAARVSFDKESDWELSEYRSGYCPTDISVDRNLSDQDAKLIRYLARHEHYTPFTHCTITLRETVPIFIARQRFKHVVGFSYNEISRRYVDDEPKFYVPDEWRERAEDKKQGSGGKHVDSDELKEMYKGYCAELKVAYKRMIDMGFAPEQARMILPQSMMTSYYVTGSLAAWARAYKLRIAEDSQKEIQELAKQWDEIIAPLYPQSWKELTNHGNQSA